MSHSLLWKHIVLLTVGVYSSNHKVLNTIGISVTKRFQKSAGSSVCNANKKAYFSIIDSRKIFHISGEKAYHPKKIKRYFQKIYFLEISEQIFEYLD